MDEGKNAHWLEVSLAVNNELAEAVAEVLTRYVSNGVVIENDILYRDADDVGTKVDRARVFGYLPFDKHLEEKRQQIEQALWYLGRIQPLPAVDFREIAAVDWMAAWKKHYKPIPIGEQLLILPAWMKNENPDRKAIRIDPSMAFGTGIHPSTQLCLQLLEKYIAPDEALIDIGCGSGILSIAGLHLGASLAAAVDTDLTAVRATGENARRNGVLERMETGQGSVDLVLSGAFSICQAPVVLANILAGVILRLLAGGLGKLVSAQGILILAGILDEQAEQVESAAREQGLGLVETRQMGDWIAMALQPISG